MEFPRMQTIIGRTLSFFFCVWTCERGLPWVLEGTDTIVVHFIFLNFPAKLHVESILYLLLSNHGTWH